MKTILRASLIPALLALSFARPVGAQEDGATYVVSYFEALPAAADRVRERLNAYVAASRGEDGNLSIQALRRIGRPNHFAVLERWESADVYASHAGRESTERFLADLAPLLYSPPDSRTHESLITGPVRSAGPDSIYVLTHVDVGPMNTDRAVELLRALAGASRAETGNLRFDVLVSARRNHMTVTEIWDGSGALEGHLGTAHLQRFRRELNPLIGALYDERLYAPL